MNTNFSYKSVFEAGKLGVALGFAGALLYGAAFVLYGIARTSAWIIAAPANALLPTLLANAVSVIIGAMFFAVLFGLAAALIQALTLVLMYAISWRWNAARSPRLGAWIGALTAGGFCLALLLLVRAGPEILVQVFWRQSFVFWFGLPGALYIALNAWLGSRMCFDETQRAAHGSRKPVLALPK